MDREQIATIISIAEWLDVLMESKFYIAEEFLLPEKQKDMPRGVIQDLYELKDMLFNCILYLQCDCHSIYLSKELSVDINSIPRSGHPETDSLLDRLMALSEDCDALDYLNSIKDILKLIEKGVLLIIDQSEPCSEMLFNDCIKESLSIVRDWGSRLEAY